MNGELSNVVLAIYPNARGYAYVVFEGPECVLEWRISDLRRTVDPNSFDRRFCTLLDRYAPGTVLLRKLPERTSKTRGTQLLPMIQRRSTERGAVVVGISRQEIRSAFSALGSPIRYAIAQELAKKILFFAPLLPPKRKIWNGEDRRMGVFDAASLVFSWYRKGQLARNRHGAAT